MRPTPLSPDFDPLGFPEGRPAPSGFGGSLHPCCSEERRQVSRVARFRRPEGPRNSAVSLRPDDPKTILASPAPHGKPESRSCFAVALVGSSEDSPSAARSALTARRRFQRHDLLHPDHPKAIRISRRSTSLIRRSTKLSDSVVGAGRDHPKSLSIPGHRRPHKVSMPKHLLLASLPRHLSGSAV